MHSTLRNKVSALRPCTSPK